MFRIETKKKQKSSNESYIFAIHYLIAFLCVSVHVSLCVCMCICVYVNKREHYWNLYAQFV